MTSLWTRIFQNWIEELYSSEHIDWCNAWLNRSFARWMHYQTKSAFKSISLENMNSRLDGYNASSRRKTNEFWKTMRKRSHTQLCIREECLGAWVVRSKAFHTCQMLELLWSEISQACNPLHNVCLNSCVCLFVCLNVWTSIDSLLDDFISLSLCNFNFLNRNVGFVSFNSALKAQEN